MLIQLNQGILMENNFFFKKEFKQNITKVFNGHDRFLMYQSKIFMEILYLERWKKILYFAL